MLYMCDLLFESERREDDMDSISSFTRPLLERAEQQAMQQMREQERQKLRCSRCRGLFVPGFGTRELTQAVRVNDQIFTMVTDVFCGGCSLEPVDDWF